MTRIPRTVTVMAGIGIAMVALPFVGLLTRVEWASLAADLTSTASTTALTLSLWTATVATMIAVVLGVPLALALARMRPTAGTWVRALVTIPLVLPPVVGGVALLATFGRQGFVGQWLDAWWGVSLPFTPAAVILAEVFVALPFLVIAVEGSLRTLPRHSEVAAATLGAKPWQQLRKVTLPAAMPGIGAGAALAWARSLGEFGATVTFAGSFPGTTQTLPLYIYSALEQNPGEAITLSVLLVAISATVLIGLRHRWLGGLPSASGMRSRG